MGLTRIFPLLLAASMGCGQSPVPQQTPAYSPEPDGSKVIKAGGVYACKSGDGEFSIVKVLVVEDGGVHVRLHTNRFREPPTAIDPEELRVAIGHVPLSEVGFRNWEPVLLLEQPVEEAELEGYRLWRDR